MAVERRRSACGVFGEQVVETFVDFPPLATKEEEDLLGTHRILSFRG